MTEPTYEQLLGDAAARAQQYLQAISSRRVGVQQESLDNLGALGGALAAQGEDPRSVLGLLDSIGSPATMASAGGRFFGGVVGGALPVTVATHWLADAWDQNACLFELSPVSAYLGNTLWRESHGLIRGRPTRINGSTFPTIAAS
jgi:aromatic-L-amino-acid decarboxylase